MSPTDKQESLSLRSSLSMPIFHLVCLLVVSLISFSGCSGTQGAKITVDQSASATPISWSRVLLEDELVGYVGFRKIDVKVGGTLTENEINYVYNTVFEILGSFDASGNTKVFRRDQPVMLGTFTPEDSFRQITGLTGRIEIVKGLQ